MKTFDYTTALLGKPVITNEGRKVHEIFSSEHRNYLTVLADGITYPLLFDYSGKLLDTSGTDFKTEKHSITNLYMAPVKRKGWVNVYPPSTSEWNGLSYVYDTEGQAKGAACSNVIATVPIEWEE
jgi:hypothetical protein